MDESPSAPEGFSLKRWSRRKLEAARSESPTPTAPAAPPTAANVAVASSSLPAAVPPAAAIPRVLPPVDSLTPDSDFSAFMNPEVDELVKRAALKKLFSDPRFNVMDGLDIYVGDYSQPDPMPEGMLEKLGKVYAAVKDPAADSQEPLAVEMTAPAVQPESAAGETPAVVVDAADADHEVLPPTVSEPSGPDAPGRATKVSVAGTVTTPPRGAQP